MSSWMTNYIDFLPGRYDRCGEKWQSSFKDIHDLIHTKKLSGQGPHFTGESLDFTGKK